MARSKAFDQQAILDKAIALFSAKGYHGISMQELVDGLGIHRSSLYDTFGDKMHLFESALRRYQEQNSRLMREQLEATTNLRETLLYIFDQIRRESMDHHQAGMGCLMVNSAVEMAPDEKIVASIFHDNLRQIGESFTHAFARAQQRGEITTALSPEALAAFFMNTVNGLRVWEKAGVDQQTFDAVVKATMKVLDV